MGEVIVAEAKASIAGCRRWVGILRLPEYDHLRQVRYENKWIVLEREIKIGAGIDYDIADEDILFLKKYYANTEEEIYDILKVIDIEPCKFTYPWKVDYPM
ncbi:hypothetical protein [Chitinophaga sp. Cy-1792]|uniref:hypothetical protein n=1 Tax=Chitinophaga sp. Cy-1792 TaxID=2608339 RepID=UPI0014205B0C|nr:hypothetical protein [Chitinophaga sp. Cy-1792]NIG53532.1 hypothetical protein [Chitinophaga sp. Cy-1792]